MRHALLLCLPLLLPLAACQRNAAPDAETPAPIAPDATTPVAPSASTANNAADVAPAATPAIPMPATSAATPAPASPAPAPAPAGESTLARFDGYGDLRFGMSEQAARRAWGGGFKPMPDAAQPCHYLAPKWTKVASDFAFMIEDDRFVRYDVGTAREAAPGGGRVGMRVAQLEALYPALARAPHKYVQGGQVLRATDPAGGKGVVVFEADADGKVTAWRAGVPPQVDYVEGCS